VLYAKIYNRMLIPLTAADQPQAPPEPRNALATITPPRRPSTPPALVFLAPRENLTSGVKNLATEDR
jgi:hypothetical protein